MQCTNEKCVTFTFCDFVSTELTYSTTVMDQPDAMVS